MTYEEFMNRPLRLRKRVLHKADDVAFKLGICLKATAVLGERVQMSRGNSKEKSIAAYVDAQRELDALMSMHAEAVGQVTEFIYGNLEFEDADLLEWRYINGKSLPDISDALGVAYQTVKNRMAAAEKRAKDKFGTVRY